MERSCWRETWAEPRTKSRGGAGLNSKDGIGKSDGSPPGWLQRRPKAHVRFGPSGQRLVALPPFSAAIPPATSLPAALILNTRHTRARARAHSRPSTHQPVIPIFHRSVTLLEHSNSPAEICCSALAKPPTEGLKSLNLRRHSIPSWSVLSSRPAVQLAFR